MKKKVIGIFVILLSGIFFVNVASATNRNCEAHYNGGQCNCTTDSVFPTTINFRGVKYDNCSLIQAGLNGFWGSSLKMNLETADAESIANLVREKIGDPATATMSRSINNDVVKTLSAMTKEELSSLKTFFTNKGRLTEFDKFIATDATAAKLLKDQQSLLPWKTYITKRADYGSKIVSRLKIWLENPTATASVTTNMESSITLVAETIKGLLTVLSVSYPNIANQLIADLQKAITETQAEYAKAKTFTSPSPATR